MPLHATSPESSLGNLLARALDVLVVVEKEREIFFLENVKFHIDTVKHLGTFIEIEAMDDERQIGLEQLEAQCDQYVNLFQIPASDLVAVSYSDLLLSASGSTQQQ